MDEDQQQLYGEDLEEMNEEEDLEEIDEIASRDQEHQQDLEEMNEEEGMWLDDEMDEIARYQEQEEELEEIDEEEQMCLDDEMDEMDVARRKNKPKVAKRRQQEKKALQKELLNLMGFSSQHTNCKRCKLIEKRQKALISRSKARREEPYCPQFLPMA